VNTASSWLTYAVSFACIVMVAICWFEEVSGAHFNPVVTLVFTILGEISPARALLYVFSQLLGAMAASGLHWLLIPNPLLQHTNYCATLLNTSLNVTPLKGIIFEILFTFFLLMSVLLTVNSSRRAMVPFVVAGMIACLTIFGGPLTGASMNPARSFGPVIVGNLWQDHYVYWVGPTLGALLALFVFKYIMDPKRDTYHVLPN